jgi:hypothetical protein
MSGCGEGDGEDDVLFAGCRDGGAGAAELGERGDVLELFDTG